jgi:polar amino acid transport system ATP-binding protein
MTARKGHVVSLIGSSGSGKSTLLRCANLLEDSQQGEILFEGEPVRWRGEGLHRHPPTARRSRASARTCRWCSSSSTSGPT